MHELTTDVAIIGAGSAGLRVHKAAKAQGASVLLIEGGQYGTTCASVGCMPSKLMIAAADAAHSAVHAGVFGVHAGPIRIDGREVMQRVRSMRDQFTGKVAKMTRQIPEHERLSGHARFKDPHTLIVGDHTLVSAKSIVIATGSRAAVLPMFRDLDDRLAVNDDVFAWQDLPESVVVFGPGIIGLELGQALHRLGVRIRMFGIQRLLGPLTDPAVKEAAEEQFGGEFPLDTDARVESVRRNGDSVAVRFFDRMSDGSLAETPSEEEFELLLAATGRTPRVDDLGLENSGLELNQQGVPLYNPATMQCGTSHIYIAGDADADVPLLHEAADEGLIAGKNAALHPQAEPGRRHVPLSIVFSDPQIAMVGATFAELQPDIEQDRVAVGSVDWANDPRARMMNTNTGLLRLYGDKESGRLLGAEMLGPHAENIGHLLAWSLEQQLTVSELLDMPYYHPVYEEGLRSGLQSLIKAMTK